LCSSYVKWLLPFAYGAPVLGAVKIVPPLGAAS
jgi:hypothetical protein